MDMTHTNHSKSPNDNPLSSITPEELIKKTKGQFSPLYNTFLADHPMSLGNGIFKSNIPTVKSLPILDVASALGIVFDTSNKALCFNGHDTIPSLSFNTSGNYFKCFGCGAGGSSIDLVMQTLHMTTHEALSWIEGYFSLIEDEAGQNGHYVEPKIHQEPKEATKRAGIDYTDIYKELMDLCDL